MSHLEELLVKLGYSKYALDSEIITEEMLDDMNLQTGADYGNLYEEENADCKEEHRLQAQADGNSFETKPTFRKTCN